MMGTSGSWSDLTKLEQCVVSEGADCVVLFKLMGLLILKPHFKLQYLMVWDGTIYSFTAGKKIHAILLHIIH